MKLKMSHIPYYVIGLLLVYVAYIHAVKIPDYQEKITVTENRWTEVVDSLESQIEYYADIEPVVIRDTISVPVPQPVIRDSVQLNEYRSSYSDSLIVASWTQLINGTLESQEFEYFLKRERVTEKLRIVTKNNYINRETTIEKIVRPKSYVSIGGFTGGNIDYIMAGPKITYTNKKRQSVFVQYDAINGNVMMGGSIPLSFPSLKFW